MYRLMNATPFELDAIWVVLAIAVVGLLYALFLRKQVLKFDKGSTRMQEVWSAIREGADAYLGKQLKTILRAAIAYKGLAVIDVLSPCVTFNNHETSTTSYRAVSEKALSVHDLDFVMAHESHPVDIPPGETREIDFPDGSSLTLRAIGEDYDPTDRTKAFAAIHESRNTATILTGLLYHQPGAPTVHDLVQTIDDPLVSLDGARTKPSREALEEINAEFLAG